MLATGAHVDVSSGVESQAGIKDRDKISRFIQAARLENDIYHFVISEMEQAMSKANSYTTGPDENGRFGIFGGRFVAETLMPLILDLEKAYGAARQDPAFLDQLLDLQTHYVGRPSPLYFAERLTEHYGGAKIYLKRDELNHTGSHKINNCLGQILLAKRMGKSRIIAETGAGHGVAVATVAARFGLPCTVFMGATDIERQKPNVFRMKLLGAEIMPVTSGAGTLKDAMNEALRDWVTNVDSTFILSALSQGRIHIPLWSETSSPLSGRKPSNKCSNARAGFRTLYVPVLAAGLMRWACFILSSMTSQSTLSALKQVGMVLIHLNTPLHWRGKPGVLHGNRTYLLQDEDGQITEGHSISAGLDYPASGQNMPISRTLVALLMCPPLTKRRLTLFSFAQNLKVLFPLSNRAMRCLMSVK